MKKPRVGIIIPVDFIKAQPFGGSTGFLQNILGQLELPVSIYGISIGGAANKKTKTAIKPNVDFQSLFRTNYPSKIPLRLKALFWYWVNRKRILRDGPNVLYIHSWETALPFLFGKKRLPVVFHQHGSTNPAIYSQFRWARIALFRWFFDKVLELAHKRADWTIAIDRLCLEQARQHSAENKVTFLMNAVDTEVFKPDFQARHGMRAKWGVGKREHVVLFVGRLEQVKRIDLAIEAITSLRTEQIACKLFIAGDGSCRGELQALAQKLQVADAVVFLGSQPHGDLAAMYNMADTLILPSEREGAPMVILEALACGTPVVATPVGGVAELVVDGKNGFLVEQNTSSCLADTLKKCLEIKWDRSSIAASILNCCSVSVTDRLVNIFQAVCKKGENAYRY